jgi:glycosyltransferase involved in cell wall biosynthesis
MDNYLAAIEPDIVHVHSVFVPKQASLAKNLIRRKIPYVVTPHGGLDFRRSRLKKILYSAVLEKPRFRSASAITIITPKEEEAVRAFVSNYKKNVRWIPNSVETKYLEKTQWKGNVKAKRLVYLGRFDVLHKGLDILVEIARLLPEVSFDLYGSSQAKTQGELQILQQNLPPNVSFHKPVFDSDKAQVLANASLYIQTSRWEGFGISIAEAMYLGLPCAIAETLNFADIFRNYDLGVVLSPLAAEAAQQIRAFLQQPERLNYWSERARKFAIENFNPAKVAGSYLNLYEEVIS